MTTAAEYVRAYQSQSGSDDNDSMELLTDFLVSYGMTDAAVEVLCQLIDEEGIAPDFGQHLRESGLVIEPGSDLAEDDDMETLD
jgi:hypothetical protein